MIRVTVRIGKEDGVEEVISAPSIREAIGLAKVRHPKEDVRVAYPIDPETFFPEQSRRRWLRA